jgi:SAM-dependent methyltransferase
MAEQRPEPVAREAYEKLADSYSARAPTKPHNAYYERPATMGLLGDVAGRRVLDAGCGPGVYAEELLARGAEVTGLDASERMIELARERLRGRAEVRRANLEEPLPWLANDSFDLVVRAPWSWTAWRTGASLYHPRLDLLQEVLERHDRAGLVSRSERRGADPGGRRSFRGGWLPLKRGVHEIYGMLAEEWEGPGDG